MEIKHRSKPNSGMGRTVCQYRDNPATLRVMLYGGVQLTIAQSASGAFYGEYEEGVTVSLYRRETLALLDALKSEAVGWGGAEWDATLERQGWLSPIDAAGCEKHPICGDHRIPFVEQ